MHREFPDLLKHIRLGWDAETNIMHAPEET